MKLTSVGLFKATGTEEPIKLGFAADLTSFGYFQRSTVADMMTFVSRTVIKRTEQGSRQSVQEQDYYCHVYVNRDGLGGVAFVDKEYPARAAFCVVYKAIDDFIAAAGDSWKAASADDNTANTVLEACLAKYQVFWCVCVCVLKGLG